MKSNHASAVLSPAFDATDPIAEFGTHPTASRHSDLNSPDPSPTAHDAESLEEAVNEFTFPACFLWIEVTRNLSLPGRLKLQLFGKEMVRSKESLLRKSAPLCWLRCKELPPSSKPLLIAPVDAAVVYHKVIGDFYFFRLRPAEKQQLRKYFTRSLRLGISIEDAEQQLQDRLKEASRTPIEAMKKQREELA